MATLEVLTLKDWPSYKTSAETNQCLMAKLHSSHFSVHLNDGTKITYFETGIPRRGSIPDDGSPPVAFDIAVAPGGRLTNPKISFKDLKRGFVAILGEGLANDFAAWSDIVKKLRQSGMTVPEGAENMTFDDFIQERLAARAEYAQRQGCVPERKAL